MFCYKCGAQIADGAAFCHRCGAKAAFEDDASQIVNETTRESVQIETDSAIEQQDAASTQVPTDEFSPAKEPSKFKKWWDNSSKPKKILAILGTLLIGIFALRFLVSFLREFGYLLLGVLVIASFIVAMVTGSKDERIEARKTIVQLAVGAVIVIIIVLVIVLKPDFISNIAQPGASVRNAYLTQYSETVTVEDAFDNFFENGKWKTYKDNGYSYVVFTGTCEYLGERADIRITFKITGEKFVVDRLDVDGKEQSDFILYGLLLKVYEKY